MSSSELKDHNREKRIFFSRTILAGLVCGLLIAFLAGRYYYLQIVQHEVYQTLSDQNRMQLQSVPPTRGLIFDRKGRLLAENQPTFTLNLVLERVGDLEQTLASLAEIVELAEDDIESFHKRRQQKRRPYESVPLKSRLSDVEIARISVNRHRLPGVDVEADLIRHYPYADLMAHPVGYVGRINERELSRVDAANYSGTHYYGKLGVEQHYEDQLHGTTGFQTVEVDVRGRVLRVLDRIAPTPGEDLVLHLDVDMQAAAAQALEGKRGAVVVMDIATGGVLALVSTPSFNPNLFVTGIDSKSYAAYRDSPDIPLFNRAIRGQYPPGSTIKPFVALAGLDTGIVNPQTKVWDPGFYQLKTDRRLYRDWKRTGHGWVDLHDAIVQSCDTYFYDLAFKAGVEPMHAYLAAFGFGRHVAHDIDNAKSGVLPSKEWKRAFRGQVWFPGDSLNMAIGQGFMLSTPLQLAAATTVLARRGEWVIPRLLKAHDGEEVSDLDHPDNITLKDETHWDLVFRTMEDVMHGEQGTARKSAVGASYRMSGKTGTAQVVGIPQGELYDEEAIAERHRDHGLFVGYAPAENPQIALAVIVENGGGGSSAAAPVGRRMFDAWLLPEATQPTVPEPAPPKPVAAPPARSAPAPLRSAG